MQLYRFQSVYLKCSSNLEKKSHSLKEACVCQALKRSNVR